MSHLKSKLKQRFTDGEYAHGYMQSHVISRIGAQIQSVRKQREWTQTELSRRSNITQEKISLYENAEFSSLTLKTLFKLAKAFDVHLNIGFSEFSKGIEDVAEFSVEHLEVIDRVNDLLSYQPNIPAINLRVQSAINLRVQSAREVAIDLVTGNASSVYVSEVIELNIHPAENQIPQPNYSTFFNQPIIGNAALQYVRTGTQK